MTRIQNFISGRDLNHFSKIAGGGPFSPPNKYVLSITRRFPVGAERRKTVRRGRNLFWLVPDDKHVFNRRTAENGNFLFSKGLFVIAVV